MYAKKLTNLGIETPASEVINTVVSMARWLSHNHPDATVFPISEEPLKRALKEASIRISERAEEIDIVVASYDRTFDYHKLQIAFDAIWYHKRARLVTTNPDRYCPFPGGRGEPDAAAIVAIEACTGARRSDYVVVLRLIESGRADVFDMVTHRFPLEDAAEAIEASAGGGGIKVAVMH
jgi:ribonucleotide monophosphatase NagD (HAD superfamily)